MFIFKAQLCMAIPPICNTSTSTFTLAATNKSKAWSSIQAVQSLRSLVKATASPPAATTTAASTSIRGMISMRAQPKASIIVELTRVANAPTATNAGFTKDTWKGVATVASWFRTRFISEIVGTMDTMPSCFRLGAYLKRLISFTINLQTEFSEWACLKD